MIERSRHLSLSRVFILAALLMMVTALVYRPAWHGGFVWDDDDYVTKNRLLTAEDGLRRIWFSLDAPSQYFPLTYTTFRLERPFWGLNPTGYHWVNILLHAGNAVLLWLLLARLRIPGAYLAAFIFAVHPVQVESVAWISERKNVLMGFFFLLTLHAWCAFIDNDRNKRWILYSLGIITFAAALSAKTTACTLPAALVLMLWLRREPITKGRLVQIAPFILMGLMMGLVTVWWERFHVNTRGAMFQMGLLERVLVASRGVWFYLSKLLWPSRLTFIYPQWTISASDPWAYVSLIACILAAVVLYVARRYAGRSIEVAMVFFVATLSPVLGFIMLYTFRYTYVADHYQYLACIGPIALVSAALVIFLRRFRHGGGAIAMISVIIVVLLGALASQQASTYSNIETLWRTTIARNPQCWMAYNNLGIALFDQGRIDDAIAQYRLSLQFRPNYEQTHYNLGVALLEKGDVEQSVAECRAALKLKGNDADAHVALGNALLAQGSLEDAIQEYKEALKLKPRHANAHYNLGNALVKRGELDSAAVEMKEAIRLQPDLVEAHMQLADIMARAGNWRGAISHYEQALELTPNSAATCNNLSWILGSCTDTSLRDGPRAIQLAEKARELAGESSVILHTLAAAYAQDGQSERAVQTAQQAIQLALREGNSSLAEDLRKEMEIYRRGAPYPAL